MKKIIGLLAFAVAVGSCESDLAGPQPGATVDLTYELIPFPKVEPPPPTAVVLDGALVIEGTVETSPKGSEPVAELDRHDGALVLKMVDDGRGGFTVTQFYDYRATITGLEPGSFPFRVEHLLSKRDPDLEMDVVIR